MLNLKNMLQLCSIRFFGDKTNLIHIKIHVKYCGFSLLYHKLNFYVIKNCGYIHYPEI